MKTSVCSESIKAILRPEDCVAGVPVRWRCAEGTQEGDSRAEFGKQHKIA